VLFPPVTETTLPNNVDGVAGLLGALVMTWLFYAYQRWRIDEYDVRTRQRAER
jgi:Mn2+/Fe2+ NRAMP family transporter